MPVPDLDIDELETVMAEGWWPLEHERLGDWLLRASAGFTGRGNSALPLGDPGCDVGTALDRVEEFYRARDLVPRFAVPGPTVGDVEEGHLPARLAARGYEPETPTAVMVADAADVVSLTKAAAPGLDVRMLAEPDDDWLSLYRYRGQPLPPAASELLTSAPYQRFAAVVDGSGRMLAVGRLAISRGWGGITAMHVAPGHRRRGLARAVLAAIGRHSAETGAPHLYLQVAAENTAARRLYAAAGFRDHHGYHYRLLRR